MKVPSNTDQNTKRATKKRAEKLQANGKPVEFKELLRMEPDGGTTNIRNVTSKHWTRWLGVENRCVVPFNSFSEFNKAEGGDIWFALDESRPLACFAGIWTTNWTSVRKVKEGETTNDLYAFLTTEPNAEVGAIHPKAMPVVLTTQEEVETWMTAPPDEALKLQRPLPDGSLRIVARGVEEDPAGSADIAGPSRRKRKITSCWTYRCPARAASKRYGTSGCGIAARASSSTAGVAEPVPEQRLTLSHFVPTSRYRLEQRLLHSD